MIRFFRLAAAAILGFVVAGCATVLVSSHVRHNIDFGRYRTFDWGPADALPTGDPRLDRNPFFKDYLQGAVERRLAEKGIELSTTGTPDLLIHYHANVTQRFDVNRVDQEYDYCLTNPCITVTDYEAGTIVLDIIDANTNRLVWRGWAQEELKALIGNQRRMRKMIDQAVTKMLQTLPTM
jgi:hypothetical protein